VEGMADFATLGLEDLLEQQATVIVEWGEKIPYQNVEGQVRIHLELLESEERRIVVEGLEK
jgi:tRNA A37 threonylcarbamoyladenosine biosynthesis protein TsaE